MNTFAQRKIGALVPEERTENYSIVNRKPTLEEQYPEEYDKFCDMYGSSNDFPTNRETAFHFFAKGYNVGWVDGINDQY